MRLLLGLLMIAAAVASMVNVSLNIMEVMADGCPSSGSIRYSGSISMDCEADTTFTSTDIWTLTETYKGETVEFVVENSDYRWTWSDPCGSE